MLKYPKLRYSPIYEINVDLEDNWCADATRANYGKHIKISQVGNYLSGRNNSILLHRVICDACVYNPRPDLFWVVDHINGKTLDNRPSNLRWLNTHLNLLNRHYDPAEDTPPGVSIIRYHTKNGKIYCLWRFKKAGCTLKFWPYKAKIDACAFAVDFNLKYFNALYQLYLHSPEDGDRAAWRRYWRLYFISTSAFKKTDRPSVLALQKFVVSDPLFVKMCGATVL